MEWSIGVASLSGALEWDRKLDSGNNISLGVNGDYAKYVTYA